MARGESGPSEKSTGIVLMALLGVMALGAMAVVAHVTVEPDEDESTRVTPEVSRFELSANRHWRTCELVLPSEPQLARSQLETHLRRQGFVPVSPWSAPTSVHTPVDASALEGGCGLVLAVPATGSHIVGTLGCANTVVTRASCGEDSFYFDGAGDIETRIFMLPGATAGELAAHHTVRQGQLEHVLGPAGFIPDPVVHHGVVPTSGLRLPAPAADCVRYVVTSTGDVSCTATTFINGVDFGVEICEGDGASVIHASEPDTEIAVRPYRRGEGSSGAPVTISAAEVHDLTTLPPAHGEP